MKPLSSPVVTSSRTRAASLAGLALLLLAGCASDGRTTSLETYTEPAGANCMYGGLRVVWGLDDSGDGRLTEEEIAGTSFVCSQRVDGRSTASRITGVPAGTACPAGGYRIEVGFDDDEDGVLEDTEVDQGTNVCEGVDGADGYTTRVRLVAIASGIAGSACPFGGTRIDSGTDFDRDGLLDDSEVDSFQSVCAVEVASSLFLVETVIENPGANCPEGGTKMTFGFDDDGDGILDIGELDGTPVYTCNQIQLVAGKTSLTIQSAATTMQCTFGGFVYRSGLDDDYDGTLDTDELDSTSVICNGTNGYAALVEQIAVSAPVCNNAGGYRIRSGLDTDRDSVLDAGEVTTDNLLCNGASVFGLDGRDSLITQQVVTSSSYCGGSGAIFFSHGLDLDFDRYLDSSEVEYWSYICIPAPGTNGANALVEVYPAGDDCSTANGVIIYSGTDYNYNGRLDGSEYTWTLLCD